MVGAGEVFGTISTDPKQALSRACDEGTPLGGTSEQKDPDSVKRLIKKIDGEGDKINSKIILIGGNFSAARDSYETPLGPMPGIELIAEAIHSDWRRGGIEKIGGVIALVFDVLVGLGVVWVFYYIGEVKKHPFWALLFVIPGSFLLVFLIAGLFFLLRYWLNVVPVVVGVNIHQFYEHAKDRYKRATAR